MASERYLEPLLACKPNIYVAEKACETYERISNMYQGLKEFAEAADALEEAGAVMKEDDPSKAIQFFKKSADMYKSAGKSDKAAKGYENCAKAYEDDLEYDLAVENYKEASRLFSMEKYK